MILSLEQFWRRARIDLYEGQKRSQANAYLLTENYIRLEVAKSMSNNMKYFFSGDDSVVGAILANIFNPETSMDSMTISPTTMPSMSPTDNPTTGHPSVSPTGNPSSTGIAEDSEVQSGGIDG